MSTESYNSAYTGAQIDEAIKDVRDNKASWSGKQDKLTFDSAPTQGSQNPVTSGGVYTQLNAVVGDIDTILENLLDGTSIAEINEVLDEINGEVV